MQCAVYRCHCISGPVDATLGLYVHIACTVMMHHRLASSPLQWFALCSYLVQPAKEGKTGPIERQPNKPCASQHELAVRSAWTCVNINASAYTCVHRCPSASMCTCMFACIHRHTDKQTSTSACARARTHTHAHTRTHAHTHTHTHT